MKNLKKFFYYYGIYLFCVNTHRALCSMPKILDETKRSVRKIRQSIDIIEGKEVKEEESGFRPKKVVNKIGF